MKQIRLDTLAKLKANGRLDVPVVKRPAKKPKNVPVKRNPTYQCCLDKYNGALPSYFRICADCPKPNEPLDTS